MSTSEIWKIVLKKVSEVTNAESFITWFGKTEAEIEGSTLIVKVPNQFVADWIESRYKSLIYEKVKEVTETDYEIQIALQNDEQDILESISIRGSEHHDIPTLKNQISTLEKLSQLQDAKIKELEKRLDKMEAEKKQGTTVNVNIN
ncbi:DnaA N-terminal domain-containing protein [Gracilibacillus sp. YIM 98692]|uniref:DnaA N-terminal domain-containing protein n=1 Tax=Gracilibacillus sp. YIM 98692 TaxID=2663532 RepID=UPI0013D0D141|nr:DnaA N-terminal domain-containing protein [Gracilibacillus sp. YIM 98692]